MTKNDELEKNDDDDGMCSGDKISHSFLSSLSLL
jgi:hypothetical protein